MYIESILFQQYRKYKHGDDVIMFSTVMYIESILLFQKYKEYKHGDNVIMFSTVMTDMLKSHIS